MIVDCRHVMDGRLLPCPRMCPCQAWPRSMFRWSRLGFGPLVLKRRYRACGQRQSPARVTASSPAQSDGSGADQ